MIMLDEPFAAWTPKPSSKSRTRSAACRAVQYRDLLTDHQFRETSRSPTAATSSARARLCYGNREQILHNPDVRKDYIGERFDIGHMLDRRGPRRQLPHHPASAIHATPNPEDDDEPPDLLGQIVTTT